MRLIPGYDPFATAGKCHFDERCAGRAISFFHDCLSHVKGELAGKPFDLEPWQAAIIGNLFGWLRPDGTRRYRECFIFVARKNGKSLMAAGICNLVLFCDGESGSEVYSAAAERDQAALVFEVAKEMVRHEPVLADACRIYTKSIAIAATSSSYKAISADANTKHGYNTHCAVIDELHAQRNRELVDVLITSTGARRQPLIVHITTSDFERESICNEKHEYASKVRDGLLDDEAFLPVIYEALLDDDWTVPETWAKANPNMGISISEDYLAHECQRAQDSPHYENTFKRLHLNIRTEQDVRWLSMEAWDKCDGAVAPESLVGRECYGGLDLGWTNDPSAFVLVFPAEDDEPMPVLTWIWMPEDAVAAMDRSTANPYRTWANQGFLRTTPGSVANQEMIRAEIRDIVGEYDLRATGFDRAGAEWIRRALEEDGLELYAHGQGMLDMSPASKELERLIMTGGIVHGGHPVLRFMASNVTIETDAAGNIKPSKKKSAEKIDGIVALVMAVHMRKLEAKEETSVYEERGVIAI